MWIWTGNYKSERAICTIFLLCLGGNMIDVAVQIITIVYVCTLR